MSNKESSAIRMAGLVAKQINGELDGREALELRQWLQASEENRALYHTLSNTERQAEHFESLDSIDTDAAFGRVKNRYYTIKRTNRKNTLLAIAATLILSISTALVIWYGKYRDLPMTQLTSQYGDDVLPGGNHAILTLSDGSTIRLDSVSIGFLVEQSGISISKEENGTIIYNAMSDGMGATGAVAFNTITTPRGGRYKIILPDGTTVWLNAASSLTYPIRFAGSERKVELSGEGYFEVAHNAQMPFIVNSGGQSVEVLGTEFNVNAYGDESAFIGTLVNGSVQVSNNNSVQSVTLIPGQQAVLKNNQFNVKNIDPIDYIAWKDGLITLSNADLPTIARKLERWYDIEFDSSNLPKGQSINGEVPANTKLSGILDVLELNTGVNFRIEGRRVVTEK